MCGSGNEPVPTVYCFYRFFYLGVLLRPAPACFGHRNAEGGGRTDNLGYQTCRRVIGLRGERYYAPGWNYDISAQYAQVSLTRAYNNEFSVTRLKRALDVVDDGSGNAVCASVVDGTDPNCVLYNIWTVGGVTEAALDFSSAASRQTFGNGGFSGPPFSFVIRSGFCNRAVCLVPDGRRRRQAAILLALVRVAFPSSCTPGRLETACRVGLRQAARHLA